MSKNIAQFRPYLFTVAYNILGAVQEAEAIKQFKDTKKFFHLNVFETSPLFSEKERLALRFATAVCYCGYQQGGIGQPFRTGISEHCLDGHERTCI